MAATSIDARLGWRKHLAALALATVAAVGLGAPPALADWHHDGGRHDGGWHDGWGRGREIVAHRGWHGGGWGFAWRPWAAFGYYAPPPVAYAPAPTYYGPTYYNQGYYNQGYDYAPQ